MMRGAMKRMIITGVITGLLLAMLAFLLAQYSASSDTPQWQSISHKLSAQVMTESFRPGIPIDVGRLRTWKIQQSEQSDPIYLVDSRLSDRADYPRVNPLCGASGCAFLIYKPDGDRHFQQIWSAYLNVNLPPTVALFEPSPDLSHGLPILKINQMEGQRIRQLRLSFDGKGYEITQTTLMPQIYE
jgi:hypothetical protein